MPGNFSKANLNSFSHFKLPFLCPLPNEINNSSGHDSTTIIFILTMLHGIWDLGSPIRDQTHTPCIGNTEFKPLDFWGSPYKSLFHSAFQELFGQQVTFPSSSVFALLLSLLFFLLFFLNLLNLRPTSPGSTQSCFSTQSPHIKAALRDFPCGPVAKSLSFQFRGPRFYPWLGIHPMCYN